MELTTLDWAVIVGYFAVVLTIGLLFAKRAGNSMTDFFISGRSLPWWIAGTSMVATTFAADTPLAVTGLVAKHGLAGNWFWWAFAMGGMFTVFVYSRLWRRAEVLTDVELIELRYSGKPAAFLRGFRSIYTALIVNSIIIGWVTGAMVTVLAETVFHGVTTAGDEWWIVIVLLLVVGAYSTLSGLWGVAVADVLQFALAMGGCIALAVIAVDHVGGIDALQTRVARSFGSDSAFEFLPDFSGTDPLMPLSVFLLMLFVQWWATWYPGAEPGGGGYVVQRMASCKDERHAFLATLWFQIAHYCIRPWPWLMISFVALALHPELRQWALDANPETEPGAGFPMVMRELAPAGLRGLMLVAFFAAFMSTISTQMNWGASYLVNDVYRRFIRRNASDRQLTTAARLASVLVLVVGGGVAFLMRDVSVDDAWKLLAALGAGTGAVFMLRWFWWRINAWSEITAMLASLALFPIVGLWVDDATHQMAIVASLTIVAWLVVTLVTPAEDEAILTAFYRKVQPGGPGWRPIRKLAADVEPEGNLGRQVFGALCASGIVYFTIPAVGAVIFGQTTRAVACFGGAVVCGGLVYFTCRRM